MLNQNIPGKLQLLKDLSDYLQSVTDSRVKDSLTILSSYHLDYDPKAKKFSPDELRIIKEIKIEHFDKLAQLIHNLYNSNDQYFLVFCQYRKLYETWFNQLSTKQPLVGRPGSTIEEKTFDKVSQLFHENPLFFISQNKLGERLQ